MIERPRRKRDGKGEQTKLVTHYTHQSLYQIMQCVTHVASFPFDQVTQGENYGLTLYVLCS